MTDKSYMLLNSLFRDKRNQFMHVVYCHKIYCKYKTGFHIIVFIYAIDWNVRNNMLCVNICRDKYILYANL